MLRKNQLRKMTLPQIMARLAAETDIDNITLINTFISEKNANLTEKREALAEQINWNRTRVQKAVKALNGRAKDRLDKTEKMVMNRNSRPTGQDISELAERYSYFQHQNGIIRRNYEVIEELLKQTLSRQEELKEQLDAKPQTEQLDKQFRQLEKECEGEEVIRNRLRLERDGKRDNYKMMGRNIEQCRVEWQVVEGQIRQAERQAVQLETYLSSRNQQDNAELIRLPQESLTLQQQVLTTQLKLNQCTTIRQELRIRQFESHRPHTNH